MPHAVPSGRIARCRLVLAATVPGVKQSATGGGSLAPLSVRFILSLRVLKVVGSKGVLPAHPLQYPRQATSTTIAASKSRRPCQANRSMNNAVTLCESSFG